MTISNELLDELLKGCDGPGDLLGDAGLMKELKIKLMERMLGAELTTHLGFEEGKDAPPDQVNRRNGTASKRLKGRDGEMPIAVPRDWDGSFEPAPATRLNLPSPRSGIARNEQKGACRVMECCT